MTAVQGSDSPFRRLLATLLLAVALATGADASRPEWARNEEQTFLTLPEWYIVWSSDEYARSIAARPPSAFPYYLSIARFWQNYARVYDATLAYPWNGGYHMMIGVIGLSYSAELAIKGVYENTLGRFAEAFASRQTDEERFAAYVAADYVAFVKVRPWYEYPFHRRLSELWSGTNVAGPGLLRKWERKLILSFEYAFKAGYGWLMGQGTAAAYAAESQETVSRVRGLSAAALADRKLRVLEVAPDGTVLVALPRYQPFTTSALDLVHAGGQFVEVAGNQRILLSTVGPRARRPPLGAAEILFALPIPIDEESERLALIVPVPQLAASIESLEREGFTIEHVYDY
jgi:hypothetical protein